MLDVFLTFFTAIQTRQTLITDKATIAKHYFKGWFWIDFITSIPFQLVEKMESSNVDDLSNSKLLRLSRLPRLYRLLRILRLAKLLKVLKFGKILAHYGINKVNSGVKEMLIILVAILFISHLMGCIWFF